MPSPPPAPPVAAPLVAPENAKPPRAVTLQGQRVRETAQTGTSDDLDEGEEQEEHNVAHDDGDPENP